jgi:hypothetical protein
MTELKPSPTRRSTTTTTTSRPSSGPPTLPPSPANGMVTDQIVKQLQQVAAKRASHVRESASNIATVHSDGATSEAQEKMKKEDKEAGVFTETSVFKENPFLKMNSTITKDKGKDAPRLSLTQSQKGIKLPSRISAQMQRQASQKQIEKIAARKNSSEKPKPPNFPPPPKKLNSPRSGENLSGSFSEKKDEKSGLSSISESRLETQAAPQQTVPERVLSKRERIALEILETEKSYVEHLKTLCDVYISPLQEAAKNSESKILSQEEINSIFSNLFTLCALNRMFLDALIQRLESQLWNDNETRVGDVFVKFGHFFKMYKIYVFQHEHADKSLQEYSGRSKFKKFIEKTEKTNRAQTLRSYLIMPIQRIPRYKLLLERLIEHTKPEHPDFDSLKSALALVTEVATNINESAKFQMKLDEIAKLQSKFKGEVNILKPGRTLIKEGTLYKGGYPYFCFLFDDLILFCKKNFSGNYTVSEQFELFAKEYEFEEINSEDSTNAFKINFSSSSIKFEAQNSEEKDDWAKAFLQGRANSRPRRGDEVAFVTRKTSPDQCKLCYTPFSIISRTHVCSICDSKVCQKCITTNTTQALIEQALETKAGSPRLRRASVDFNSKEKAKSDPQFRRVCDHCVEEYGPFEKDTAAEGIDSEEEEDTLAVKVDNIGSIRKKEKTRSALSRFLIPTQDGVGKAGIAGIMNRAGSIALSPDQRKSKSEAIVKVESFEHALESISGSSLPEVPTRPQKFIDESLCPPLPSKAPLQAWKANRVKQEHALEEYDMNRPVLFKVVALYDYSAHTESELSFKEGDHIDVLSTEDEESGWWEGKFKDTVGFFPLDFVSVLQDVNVEAPVVFAVALKSCHSNLPGLDPKSEPTLFFNLGDVLQVHAFVINFQLY